MLAARFPMYIMMGATLLFNQAPELSEKIVSCIKNRVEKSDFLVNALISEQLGRQISDYVQQNAERFMLHKKGF